MIGITRILKAKKILDDMGFVILSQKEIDEDSKLKKMNVKIN